MSNRLLTAPRKASAAVREAAATPAAKEPRNALMLAAVNCRHEMEDSKITLYFERGNPAGDTALGQLATRLVEAHHKLIHGTDPQPGRVALALAREAAKEMRTDAAFGGQPDDGGAGRLESLCAAFEAGQRGTVPEFLREYMAQAEREADPEYAQYQRLHAKFGGKS